MEWIWAGAIAGGIVAFLVGIDLLSRWSESSARAVLPAEEDDDDGPPAEEDVDGTDEAITDADE